MTDNSRRGVEQWRCGLCQSINDMVDNICVGCHYDYDKETDETMVVTKIVRKKKEFEFVKIEVKKKEY